jgi:hypothetical protein
MPNSHGNPVPRAEQTNAQRLWTRMNPSALSLEVLNFSFVPFRGLATGECSQIAPAAGLGVDLPRIESILAGLQSANHCQPPQ